MQEGNKGFGMLENMQFGWEFFALSLAAYRTVDFEKVVSDLFHADSILAESECIKRKTKLSQ